MTSVYLPIDGQQSASIAQPQKEDISCLRGFRVTVTVTTSHSVNQATLHDSRLELYCHYEIIKPTNSIKVMQKTIKKGNRKHRVLGPPKGPDTSEAGAAPPPRPDCLVDIYRL